MPDPLPTDTKETKQDLSFGELAVRARYCTPDHVKECLEIQARLRAIGIEPKRLGEIMVDKRFLSPEQCDKLAQAQSQHPARSGKMAVPGYEILNKIGQGAMGAVWRARQISMDRTVAIKVLAPKYSRDEKYVQRFLNEARSVAKLNHENVISGIDVGESNGIHYFVMEYVDGNTVARILTEQGRIDEKRCLQIAQQTAKALEHAHRHGILHRDIKPENIMITTDGVAKLCDLGLAKQQTGDATSSTMDGMCVGTPNYIAPEQARGEQNLDIRTDIYSLGATLYHMSTGRTPFSGPNPMAVMTKHVTDFADPVRKVNPALSEGFSNLVQRMMQKHKQERYQTPAELAADLDKLLRGDTVATAAHPGKSSQVKPPTGQFRVPVRHARGTHSGIPSTWVGVAAVLLLAGIAWIVVPRGGSVDPAPPLPGPATGVPMTSEDAKKSQELLEAFREVCARLLQENSEQQLTDPYARLEEGIARFRMTREELTWLDEKKKWTESMNERVTRTVWTPIRDEADRLRRDGKLREAIAHADTLEARYRWFRRSERAPDLDVPSDAEKDRRRYAQEVLQEVAALGQRARVDLEKACEEGRFEEAYRMCTALSAHGAGAEEIARLRLDVARREIARLAGDPLTPAKEAAASKRIEQLAKAHAGDEELQRFLESVRESLKRRLDEARSGAAEKAKAAYEAEFVPAFRKAAAARDVAAMRAAVRGLCASPKHEAARMALVERFEDLALIEAWLGATAPDFAKLAKMAEDGIRSGRPTVVELSLDLREAALVEELLQMAMRGAEGKGRPLKGPLAGAELKPVARKAADAPYQVEGTTGGATQKFALAPSAKPASDAETVVQLAERVRADKDPLWHLRAAILYFLAGEECHAQAKSELLKAGDAPGLDRYRKALAGVPTREEEDKAAQLWKAAMDIWTNPKKDAETKALFNELIAKYAHTKFANTVPPRGQKTPLQTAREWLAEGNVRPKKVEDLFHAKVKAAGKDRYEVSYEFAAPETLEDFTKDPLGFGTAATWAHGEKAINGDESGILNWKPVVRGDVFVEWRIKARDGKNIGFTFPATGTLTAGEGYLAWLQFENVSGFGPNRIGVWPQNPILKLPWNRDRRAEANFGVEKNDKWEMAPGQTYLVQVARKGRAVELAVDRGVLTTGELTEPVVQTGKIGVAIWQSKVTLIGAKLNVQFDPAWLAEALKPEPPKSPEPPK